jgi:hypothetical protein
MTSTTRFATADQARTYIRAHDHRVIQLDRKPLGYLRNALALAQRANGLVTVFGGPVSRDEHISAIIELEYPDIRQAREVYVNAATMGA